MKIVAFTDKSDQGADNLTELYLPCPRSNRRSVYFHNEKGELYEVQKVTGPGRKASWLIKDTIYKDGSVRFLARLDPLFLALPIIERASKEGKFKTLDDIFSREHVSIEVVIEVEEDEEDMLAEELGKPIDIHRLTDVPGLKAQLAHVCEIKEIASNLFVYKLDQDLALNWLVKKVNLLVSNTQFKSSFDTTKEDAQSIKVEAVYTLANYLSKQWFTRLLDKLDLVEKKEELGDITNYATDESPVGYFKRVHPDEKFLDGAQAKKKKPDTPRSLAKVDTRGMKSLTSFFAPVKKV